MHKRLRIFLLHFFLARSEADNSTADLKSIAYAIVLNKGQFSPLNCGHHLISNPSLHGAIVNYIVIGLST